jgi:hypothetical protein
MKRLALLAVVIGLVFATSIPAKAAGEGEVMSRLIEAQTDSVVVVKFVLNVHMTFHGQSQDQEISGRVNGVMVDPVGLIMLPARAFKPQFRGRGGQQPEMQATPTNVRVVFPGDPKEYEAVVGATDSRLGLSFVRIKDLEGRKVKALDLEQTGEVKIGDRLYGVTRLGQGFDFAPFCDFIDVVGEVKKPRKAWTIRGRFIEAAHPLFTAGGMLAGFVIMQEGVGSSRAFPFLLPPKVATSTIQRAGKESQKVLEEALEADAEAAAAEGESATPPAPGEDGNGPVDEEEKPAMPEQDPK